MKPFYYRFENERLVFASEAAAFRADAGTTLEPNRRAVREYLEQAYLDHTDETFLDGVRRLPPAHSLVLDERGLRVDRYWRLEPHDAPAGDAAEAFRELFLDSVRLQLRSDVPLGTASPAGSTPPRSRPRSTTCCGPRRRTRAPSARGSRRSRRSSTRSASTSARTRDAVVEQTDAEPHWVTFDAEDLTANLPAIVEAQGEPFGSTSIAAAWYVMRAAREAGITVMLDGQGGDELLGGYRAHLGYPPRRPARERSARRARAASSRASVRGTEPRRSSPPRRGRSRPERSRGSSAAARAARRRSSTPSWPRSTRRTASRTARPSPTASAGTSSSC